MKFKDLPEKYKREAEQIAVDRYNDLEQESLRSGYESEAYEFTADDEAIQIYLAELEFDIEKGEYEPGVPFERLVIL